MQNIEAQGAGFETASAKHYPVTGLAIDAFAVGFQFKGNAELAAVGIF